MSENESRPSRRLIVTPSVQHAAESRLMIEPDVPTLISDALSVISVEILKFKSKVNSGKTLDLREARVLQGYIKSLVDLSREYRERDDQRDLANVGDGELLELISKLKAKSSGAP